MNKKNTNERRPLTIQQWISTIRSDNSSSKDVENSIESLHRVLTRGDDLIDSEYKISDVLAECNSYLVNSLLRELNNSDSFDARFNARFKLAELIEELDPIQTRLYYITYPLMLKKINLNEDRSTFNFGKTVDKLSSSSCHSNDIFKYSTQLLRDWNKRGRFSKYLANNSLEELVDSLLFKFLDHSQSSFAKDAATLTLASNVELFEYLNDKRTSELSGLMQHIEDMQSNEMLENICDQMMDSLRSINLPDFNADTISGLGNLLGPSSKVQY